MIYIGIDPGLDGGIAAIDDTGGIVRLERTPVLATGNRREFDGRAAADMVRAAMERGACKVFIENVHSMPKQGVASSFSFGKGLGRWEGIIYGLGLPLTHFTPQRWKKTLLDGKPKEKSASILAAKELFPKAQLTPAGCRTPKDGLAEALLIAECGRRLR